jgi:hypothetical protein
MDITKILQKVAKFGENDGVCTRLYINVFHKDGYDCLAVGYCNDEPQRLLTFWQTSDDEDFHTRTWSELKYFDKIGIFLRIPFNI